MLSFSDRPLSVVLPAVCPSVRPSVSRAQIVTVKCRKFLPDIQGGPGEISVQTWNWVTVTYILRATGPKHNSEQPEHQTLRSDEGSCTNILGLFIKLKQCASFCQITLSAGKVWTESSHPVLQNCHNRVVSLQIVHFEWNVIQNHQYLND